MPFYLQYTGEHVFVICDTGYACTGQEYRVLVLVSNGITRHRVPLHRQRHLHLQEQVNKLNPIAYQKTIRHIPTEFSKCPFQTNELK